MYDMYFNYLLYILKLCSLIIQAKYIDDFSTVRMDRWQSFVFTGIIIFIDVDEKDFINHMIWNEFYT